MQDEFNTHFPLLHGNAEQVPYPDASFDVAISEHGADAWCDPYRWIPEAARLLRPAESSSSSAIRICSHRACPMMDRPTERCREPSSGYAHR